MENLPAPSTTYTFIRVSRLVGSSSPDEAEGFGHGLEPQDFRGGEEMPGKLPIDRVRAAEDAPRVYQEEKRRFAEEQAKLRDRSPSSRPEAGATGDDAREEHDDA